MLKKINNLVAKTVVQAISRQSRQRSQIQSTVFSIYRNSSSKTDVAKSSSQVTTTPLKNDEAKTHLETESDVEDYDREFHEHQIDEFKSLFEEDASGTMRDKIETVLKEYEYHKYNLMGRVPGRILPDQMAQLIEENSSPQARERHLQFLFKREMAKLTAKRRKLEDSAMRSEIRAVKLEEMTKKHGGERTGLITPDGRLIYGLWHNSLFCRIPESLIKTGPSSKLTTAAMFGRKLIFDFDFENQMDPWVYRNVVDQVQEAYGINRHRYQEPFDIWFCNFDRTSKGNDYLRKKSITNLYDTSLITIKSGCFTKYFEKSRLVYLTPDSRYKLADINNSDDIYIIGVYNDKGTAKPLTYRKATEMGLRTGRLPLDSYVAWRGGSKSLCVNHVTGILLEAIKNGGNWREAFTKHIPSRKLKPVEMIMEEEERRRARFHLKAQKKFNIRQNLDL